MIFFVWSLLASAIGYVKRQRLAVAVNAYLTKPGSLMFRRLQSTLSAALRTSATAATSVTVCQVDKIEVLHAEQVAQLDVNQWNMFDNLRFNINCAINQMPVYFVASMSPYVDIDCTEKHPVENICVPIAWRASENLEVVFGSSFSDFVDLACDWSDGLVVYRNFFDLTHIETVLLSNEFKNALTQFTPSSPVKVTNSAVSPEHHEQQSYLLQGLEQLCLKDIIGAKDLCRNIATFASPEHTHCDTPEHTPQCEDNSQQSSKANTPIITQQPLMSPSSVMASSSMSLTVHSKCSPIDETAASISTYDLRPTSELHEYSNKDFGSARQLEVDEEDDDNSSYHRRRSPCHGFNGRLVDKSSYFSNRCNSLTSVNTEEMKNSARKQRTRSTLSVSEGYENVSRRLSLPMGRSRSMSNSAGLKFRRLSTISATGIHGKPPNIFIYCGVDDVDDSSYSKLRDSLIRSLNSSKYVVYRLKHERFLKDPWSANAACLVLADLRHLDESYWSKLYDYFRSGGKLLFLCENRLLANLADASSAKKRFGLLKLAFDSSLTANKEVDKFLKKLSKNMKASKVCEQCSVKTADGRHAYTLSVLREASSPLIFYMQNSHHQAGALFSDMTLDAFYNDEGIGLIKQILERLNIETLNTIDAPKLSCGYLIFENENCVALEIEQRLLRRGRFDDAKLSMDFAETLPTDKAKIVERCLPVVCSSTRSGEQVGFNTEEYFSNLKSSTFGKSVLFVSVATSTMTICDSLSRALPNEPSFIVIARQQMNGQGRSGNQWLSPVGCSMFSLGYKTTTDSRLGQYSGYVQHIVALSVVDSICRLPGFESLDLRLKWPNDIYYGSTTKLGGVLVNCTFQGNSLNFIIGCGMNVANSAPTTCLNELLPDVVEQFSCERVIAMTVTRLEELFESFSAGGHETIWPLYYKYWLHRNQELTLSESNERVVVRGLDKHGFLEVRSRQNGKLFSLQPDGNSLDMMHNLIKMK